MAVEAAAAKYKENMEKYPRFESLEEVFKVYRKELDALKEKTKSDVDDLTAYRFLKGWKFELDKAAEEMGKMVEWRKTNKVDDIRLKAGKLSPNEFPYAEKLAKCYPKNPHHGFDKSGQPIIIEKAGKVNLALLLQTVSLQELTIYSMYTLEKAALLNEELASKTGKMVRSCHILDLDGLGSGHMNKAGIALLRSIVAMGTANYPESLGTMYIVNAPWVFNAVWGIVKPWLKESTQKKIQILGSDFHVVLKNAIDEDTLPQFLGGKCTCDGKGCVPEADPDAGMTAVEISARGNHVFKIKITPGQVLEWEFRTKGKDIGFGVKTAKGEVIVKDEKMNSHLEVVRGNYECPNSGEAEVVLTWDNSYSRFTGKSLVFRTEVVDKAKLEQKAEELA